MAELDDPVGGVADQHVDEVADAEAQLPIVLAFDPHHASEFAADATGPLVKDKLYYYAVYAHDYTDSDLQYYYNRKDLYAAGLTYVAAAAQSIAPNRQCPSTNFNSGSGKVSPRCRPERRSSATGA